jgi:ribosome biogenesis protein YTM1
MKTGFLPCHVRTLGTLLLAHFYRLLLNEYSSRHFLSASYDGHIRIFNYSQNLLSSHPAHSAPITSLCLVPSPTDSETDTHLIATASHDLTAQLTRFSLSSEDVRQPKALATLHLHTAPLSSVASDSEGQRLLTSSWDGLIGLWDTAIPTEDEVPIDRLEGGDRKKRRKVTNDASRPKRKAPVTVLKSHTARVSRVIFGKDGSGKVAHSCGFDSTVRTWDVENGLCTHTIVS